MTGALHPRVGESISRSERSVSTISWVQRNASQHESGSERSEVCQPTGGEACWTKVGFLHWAGVAPEGPYPDQRSSQDRFLPGCVYYLLRDGRTRIVPSLYRDRVSSPSIASRIDGFPLVSTMAMRTS